MMKNRDGRHRRRRAAVLIAVASSLGSSHSVVTSASAGKHFFEHDHLNSLNLRRRRATEVSPVETTHNHHRQIESINSECKGSALYPGDILEQNEFICHGQLRFGIDYRGRFILGFAVNNTQTTPEMIAWQAKPTSLFVDAGRPFGFVTLANDGNILGFDLSNNEIYDSNYDYQNRQQGKEDGSILRPSDDCIVADFVQRGTFCVSLASQPKPGMPNGMTTWGLKVDNDTMIPFEPPSASPTSAPSLQPSQQITEDSGAGTWNSTNSSHTPTTLLTVSPSYSPSFKPSSSSIQIGSQAKKTIIYGYVWLDDDRDGEMGREETRFSDFEVKFYECVANGRVSAAGSVRTDAEGLYFIQLPYGQYRALYEVDQDVYGYSVGVQFSDSGWTDCTSSSKTIIASSVGLYSKTVTPLIDVPSSEAAIIINEVPDLPPATEAAADSEKSELAKTEQELAKTEEVKFSSISGFVYMDTNINRIMDPDERSMAVKGYTVGDAIVKVSLIDCQPDDSVLPSVKFVSFPGHYMFGNLTEGSYKLKFELISVDPNATVTSMYTFTDGTSKVFPSRETQCGKLGQGQDNDQGDIGVQPIEIAPLQGEIETESASADIPFVSKTTQSGIQAESGDGNSDVSGIIGGVVVACVLVAAVAFFVVRKHQSRQIISVGRSHKAVSESRGNLGSSLDADMSTTSDGGSTLVDNRHATGTNVVDQELDDISESSRSSDDDSYGDDSHQSSIDYGPVVSNIIAQYSQQQQQQLLLQQQQQQQQHNKIEAYSRDEQHVQHPGGYYNDSRSQHYQQQHYQGQYHHDQYDSASTYSNNSADPPAASYTSLSHQNELANQEGYEVQYEKHSPVHSDSDSEFSAEESDRNDVIVTNVPSQPSPGSRSRSNPRDDRDTSSWKRDAIPEHATVVYSSNQVRERESSPHVDDSKSEMSAGSDHSSDPPGASYKDTPLDLPRAPPPRQKGNRGRSVPPPPPRKFPSPQQQRYVSPQQQRRISPQQHRYVSPQQQRRISPQQHRYASPQERRHVSPSSGRFSTYPSSQET